MFAAKLALNSVEVEIFWAYHAEFMRHEQTAQGKMVSQGLLHCFADDKVTVDQMRRAG
jgi:hypothetical protein